MEKNNINDIFTILASKNIYYSFDFKKKILEAEKKLGRKLDKKEIFSLFRESAAKFYGKKT